jgi:uroporphyrinogen-III synthase
MRVLVTRPRPQAIPWVDALCAQGVDAQALPLIDILPPPDEAALSEQWLTLEDHALVFFASPNAVERFFAARPPAASWPAGLPAAAPGPGSALALRDAGVALIVEPPVQAAKFDSEALWSRLEAWPWEGASVLMVRGDGGRDWLAERLRSRGARVRFVQAYARAMPAPTPQEQRLLREALEAPQAHVWHFSSAQAIDHLERLVPGTDWSHARAIASHPRIAERARALGFGVVHEAPPTMHAVVAALQHATLQSSAS